MQPCQCSTPSRPPHRSFSGHYEGMCRVCGAGAVHGSCPDASCTRTRYEAVLSPCTITMRSPRFTSTPTPTEDLAFLVGCTNTRLTIHVVIVVATNPLSYNSPVVFHSIRELACAYMHPSPHHLTSTSPLPYPHIHAGITVRYQNLFQCWPGVALSGVPIQQPFISKNPDECARKVCVCVGGRCVCVRFTCSNVQYAGQTLYCTFRGRMCSLDMASIMILCRKNTILILALETGVYPSQSCCPSAMSSSKRNSQVTLLCRSVMVNTYFICEVYHPTPPHITSRCLSHTVH